MNALPIARPELSPPPEIVPYQAIRHLDDALDLSTGDLASALSVNRRTVERWLSGKSFPRSEACQRLAVLVRVADRLRGTFTDKEAAIGWLHGPNRYLRGVSPVEEIRAGHFDRVDGALEVIDSGIFV